MAGFYFEKNLNRVFTHKKLENLDFQKYIMHGFIVMILIIATISMAIADESILTQSFSNSENGENSLFSPRGHIEDFSWEKRVSSDGVIEIIGISFSVVNDDNVTHSFEICPIIQGPIGKFTPSLDSPLVCTNTIEIQPNKKLNNQLFNFPSGIKVSELIDISIAIQEFE